MARIEGDPGAMAALRATADVVRGFLVDGAVIANVNHPRQVVISGTTEAVTATCEVAAASDVEATLLDVSHAFHSPVLDGLDAATWLAGIDLADPSVPVVSAISGAAYRGEEPVRCIERDEEPSGSTPSVAPPEDETETRSTRGKRRRRDTA